MNDAEVLTYTENPLARPDVSSFPLDDDLVLSKEGNGEVFVLNSTGAFIWQHCDGRHAIPSIVEAIVNQFGVPASEAMDDVLELIGNLHTAELLATD